MRDLAKSRQADVIFEGLVVSQVMKKGSISAPQSAMSMTPRPTYRVVKVRALRTYRGVRQGTYTILTGMGGGDCGCEFEAGRKYIIYADRVVNGRLFTSICHGTTPLEEAGPDLRFLRKLPPLAEDLLPRSQYRDFIVSKSTGTVCGQVRQPDGTPLADAAIRLQLVGTGSSSDSELGTTSEADGTFCIEGVSPNKYLLVAEKKDQDLQGRFAGFYPGVWNRVEAVPIDVKAGVTQTGLDFGTQRESTFAIRLWIVTSDGSPAPWQDLEVALDGQERNLSPYHAEKRVEADWSCTFSGVPAGSYTASIRLSPDLDNGLTTSEVSMWEPKRKEIDLVGPEDVTLELVRRQ